MFSFNITMMFHHELHPAALTIITVLILFVFCPERQNNCTVGFLWMWSCSFQKRHGRWIDIDQLHKRARAAVECGDRFTDHSVFKESEWSSSCFCSPALNPHSNITCVCFCILSHASSLLFVISVPLAVQNKPIASRKSMMTCERHTRIIIIIIAGRNAVSVTIHGNQICCAPSLNI